MKQRAALLALVLISMVLTAITLFTPAAEAAVPTCLGKKATIVGRTDGLVRGTRGDDVIVTLDDEEGFATGGPGDDLICIRGAIGTVYAGPGDDRVVGGRSLNDVDLGPGADWFRGGRKADHVFANVYGEGDGDKDIIRTRAGRDVVETLGLAGKPFRDVVSLGAGRDHLVVSHILRSRGKVSFGAGDGRLDLRSELLRPMVVDNRKGLVSSNGTTVFAWDGPVSTINVSSSRAVDFVGSARGENVQVTAGGTVRTRGGDDVIRNFPSTHPAYLTPSSTLDGGVGRDRLVMRRYDGATVADLGGTFTGPWGGPIQVAGLEDLRMASQELVVRGTDEANSLTVTGCSVTVEGLGGDDEIAAGSELYADEGADWWSSCGYDAEVRGGAGDDRIRTYYGDDRLYGDSGDDHLDAGGGEDRADGGEGRDTCVADEVFSCEE